MSTLQVKDKATTCTVCNGTGQCHYCLGLGKRSGSSAPIECDKCQGTGRCFRCGKPRPVAKLGKREVSDGTMKLGNRLLAVNSCPNCGGDERCHECDDKGIRHGEQCSVCGGSKVCRKCHEHVRFLKEFVHECASNSYGPAEAVLIRGLQWTVEAESQNKSVYGMKGMGGGALIGTFIAPGIGTVLGGMLGKMLGDTVAVTDIPDKLSWRRADLWFCMGLLYQLTNRRAEASQAWIKSLTYKADHEPSRYALKQVI